MEQLPHVPHDRQVRQTVVDAGFDSAAAVKNAFSHDRDDPFAIARITVTADTTAVPIHNFAISRGKAVSDDEGSPAADPSLGLLEQGWLGLPSHHRLRPGDLAYRTSYDHFVQEAFDTMAWAAGSYASVFTP